MWDPGTMSCRRLFFCLYLAVILLQGESLESSSPSERRATDPKAQRPHKAFFGSGATTTYTDFSIVTSQVFFSCLVGTVAANACQKKRRKRQFVAINSVIDHKEDVEMLDSSKGNIQDIFTGNKRSGKYFGITIWTTIRTTSTVTILSTNTATTVRLSYYCLAGNINLPKFNCGVIPG